MESKMEKKGGLRFRGISKKNTPLSPLVSVITVSFNAASTIQRTIDSVLALTYPNIEYIIIDGGSTDDTLNLIKQYESQIDYWLSESDNGIYDGMNKGIGAATGEWINFMNCGDRFASAHSLNFFENIRADADIIYGKAIVEYPGITT